MKISKLILIALGVSLVAGHAWAAPYVILKDGTRVDGTQIRALPNGNINLQVGAGMRTFPKGSYIKAVADKPAEFDRGMAAMQAKKYDEAVKLFEGIVSRYRMLDWDIQAGRQLAEARLGKGDAEGAVKAYEQLFETNPAERQNADSPGHAPRHAGRQAVFRLTKQLDVVAASGSRADAAAQKMRGDIQLAQNNIEPAALDYLRTAILFQDVKDPIIQGEACFKTAAALEQLRHANARDLYKKASEYTHPLCGAGSSQIEVEDLKTSPRRTSYVQKIKTDGVDSVAGSLCLRAGVVYGARSRHRRSHYGRC